MSGRRERIREEIERWSLDEDAFSICNAFSLFCHSHHRRCPLFCPFTSLEVQFLFPSLFYLRAIEPCHWIELRELVQAALSSVLSSFSRSKQLSAIKSREERRDGRVRDAFTQMVVVSWCCRVVLMFVPFLRTRTFFPFSSHTWLWQSPSLFPTHKFSRMVQQDAGHPFIHCSYLLVFNNTKWDLKLHTQTPLSSL